MTGPVVPVLEKYQGSTPPPSFPPPSTAPGCCNCCLSAQTPSGPRPDLGPGLDYISDAVIDKLCSASVSSAQSSTVAAELRAVSVFTLYNHPPTTTHHHQLPVVRSEHVRTFFIVLSLRCLNLWSVHINYAAMRFKTHLDIALYQQTDCFT